MDILNEAVILLTRCTPKLNCTTGGLQQYVQ